MFFKSYRAAELYLKNYKPWGRIKIVDGGYLVVDKKWPEYISS